MSGPRRLAILVAAVAASAAGLVGVGASAQAVVKPAGPATPACVDVFCQPCPILARLAGLVTDEPPFYCIAAA